MLEEIRASASEIPIIRRDVESLRETVEAEASITAERFKATLDAMVDEAKVAPRMFTLIPVEPRTWRERVTKVGRLSYQITFWCEHPDESHPVCPIGSGGPGE